MDPLQVLATLAVGLGVGALGTRWLLRRRGAGGAGQVDTVSFVAEHIPIAVLLFATDGSIRFANARSVQLLFSGESPIGRNFLRMLDHAPSPVREALLGTSDALFTLEHEGELETFQMLRREVLIDGEPHFLLLINPLTREVSRREIEVLRKVIRVISHELNNSLASMASLVESARYIVDNQENLPKLAHVLDGIEGRTKHLKHFLAEYAALSRLPKPRPKRLSLEGMARRLREMFPDARFDEAPERPVWLDEAQVEQALINLLKNANEAGGPAEEVRLVVRERSGAMELGVLDRGKGFSNDALQHGLLPFFSTKPGGSGVGLALCREVAEGHGGSLRIKARQGGGSAVYLVLPGEQRGSDGESVALTLTRT